VFLLNELIFLSPLLIYAYLRIRKLIVGTLSKRIFAAFFILLCLAFPVAEIISHNSGRGWARSLMITGYYSLPLLLYLVLVVILTDFTIGAAHLSRLVSSETLRAPGLRKARLCFVLAAPVIIVCFGIANYHHLRIKEYSIEVPRRSSEIARLKIAFAADFHLGDMTTEKFMEGFVDKVNALDPDIVLIGGDVLEGHGRADQMDGFIAQFRRLKSKYGVYAVPGNHEMYGSNRVDFFARAGIRLLEDEVEKIDGAFYLAGRKDSHSRERKSIDELLSGTPPDLPVILLDHRPTDLDRVSQSQVDIQLSGHTHNGQLFPVNFITQRQYELTWGYKKKRQTHFFVTSGVQLWGPRVRTAGRSEILIIKVVFRDQS